MKKNIVVIFLLLSFAVLKSMEQPETTVQKDNKVQYNKTLCICCGCEEVDHVEALHIESEKERKKLNEEFVAFYLQKLTKNN